jgi:hypothetical protein
MLLDGAVDAGRDTGRGASPPHAAATQAPHVGLPDRRSGTSLEGVIAMLSALLLALGMAALGVAVFALARVTRVP